MTLLLEESVCSTSVLPTTKRLSESNEEGDEGYGHCESHVLSKMHSATH